MRSCTSGKRQKPPFWKKNQKKIRTTKVATKITTKKSKIRIEEKAELAETASSCNDCVATIVARPFTTTVKGRKTAFRKEDKGVISPDSGIRRGLGI